MQNFEGIYEEPSTKMHLFASGVIPNESSDIKITFSNGNVLAYIWETGKAYYYAYDEYFIDVFVTSVAEESITINMKIY